jgi:carboxypeptidase family protein
VSVLKTENRKQKNEIKQGRGFCLLFSVFCLGTFTIACGGGSTAQQPPPPPPPFDPSTAGSISGTVKLEGTPPPAEVIRLDADPKCVTAAQGEERRTEDYVVGSDNEVQNVFVYVKEGLPQRLYPVPTGPVVLDQQKCRYIPRVMGVQVGQPFVIQNSDPFMHNIHAEGAVNQPFDLAEPLQGIRMTKTFATREVMVPIKCNVHAWMHAFVGVVEHPFFAVSNGSGQFSILQLPPGTYTLEAWHERLGTATQQVTVGPKEAKPVNFSFRIS